MKKRKVIVTKTDAGWSIRYNDTNPETRYTGLDRKQAHAAISEARNEKSDRPAKKS